MLRKRPPQWTSSKTRRRAQHTSKIATVLKHESAWCRAPRAGRKLACDQEAQRRLQLRGRRMRVVRDERRKRLRLEAGTVPLRSGHSGPALSQLDL